MNSDPRITLSRIIAVNWYGYRQFIDLHGLTLITGANGSGKSALLDLIQFVLLGEQTSKFNKAAAGAGSGRTLRGYCLCDTNTVGRDGQERFLRSSGVTIAALEFTSPIQPGETESRRQTWGARIEYESTSSKGRTLWFHIPGRLEQSDFLRENERAENSEFLPEDEFRVRLKRDRDGDPWEHQRTYLEEMKQRAALHFDREQMNKTLPKAMAFQPESNFEAFIRDYLLEAAMPDVKAVKASVDAHRRAKERLDKMHDQYERLKQIVEHHSKAVQHRRETSLWEHLRDALAHEECSEKLHAAQKKLAEQCAQNESDLRAREDAIAERNELRARLDEVRLVVGQDSQATRLKEDRDKLASVQKELVGLRNARKTASQFLHDHAVHWRDWLRLGESLGNAPSAEASEQLSLLRGNDEAQALDAVARLSRAGDALLNEAHKRLEGFNAEVKRKEAREAELRRDLDHYREGRLAPSPLLDALRARGQRAVALGRVVEVKPEAEAWWSLLETLLAKDRQAIIAEDFAAAWEEAQRTPSLTEPLIRMEELRGKTKTSLAGSARSFIETEDANAAAYLDHLLGDLMPVEHLAALDQHERALCRDGWLKDPPRRERLVEAKELTLGKEGLRRLRELRETELKAVCEELTKLRRQRDDWRGWVERAQSQSLTAPNTPNASAELRRLPDAEKERQTLEETIRLLETPELKATVEKLRQLEATFEGVVERIGRLQTNLESLDQQQRVLRDQIQRHESEEHKARLQRETSRVKLTGILDTDINERITSAKTEYPSWQKRHEAAAEMTRQESERAKDSLRLRNEARQNFAVEHSEMADVFDPLEEDNERYDERCRKLKEQDLEHYQAEADKARHDWEERLQHQVLDVLRGKLDDAERTKKELNRAMLYDIGGIRYQITSREDKAHTAIWALVKGGLPSGAEMELFNNSQRDDIERAKSALLVAIEAADSPDDKRNQRALDYRYYHHWDIEARAAGKGDEAAISLNKSAKKQSGGENQAPIFVATLAAFRRVYDVGGKSGPPTLGLVVMDEAFSKLSGDRIDDCLALARNFGLQLVMAFPEDRLPTMIEHAETVVQCRVDRSYDDTSGAVTGIENSVIILDRERVQEALG